MSAKTRRQKAAQAAQSDSDVPSPASNGAVKTPKRNKSKSPPQPEARENVFLFAPNLIGTYLRTIFYWRGI